MSTVLCWVFGHKYLVIKRYGFAARKVGCRRCKRAWGMHDPSQSFVPWDSELEELHEGGKP